MWYNQRDDKRRHDNRSESEDFQLIVQYLVSSLRLHNTNSACTKFKLIGTLVEFFHMIE